MEKERKIHYVDSFKFSFVLPVYTKFRYEIKLRTTGLNSYKAGLEYRHHEWFCSNCELRNDEITVFVREHNLAPGKLYCQITLIDKEGREHESLGIDPHIMLTYDHIHTEKHPSDVDTQQSIDIVKLYDKYYELRDKIITIEESDNKKTSIKDNDGEIIPNMWITYEDEKDFPVYTKWQTHDRFVSKDEIKKYVKMKTVEEMMKNTVDKKYLQKHYFDKSEAYNTFLKQGDFYTKDEVDKLLYKMQEQIDALQS